MTSTSSDTTDLSQDLSRFTDTFQKLVTGVQQQIVGYDDLITDVLTAIFSGGHVLLEGVPGLGKTTLVKVLSEILDLAFGRIQCTPDLMPADILGTHIVAEDGAGGRVFRFERGPVFTQLLLVDEINRATPKTQAALLEVMQEHTVTAAGERFVLDQPFAVLATQNPLEMEGTYPLPEAQLDRFMFKCLVPFPTRDQLVEISRRTTGAKPEALASILDGPAIQASQRVVAEVPIAESLTAYAASLILATHPDQEAAPESVRRYVSYGSSPRGMQTLIRGARVRAVLAGRTAVALSDLHTVAHATLRHRIILNFEGEAESIQTDRLIDDILAAVPTPAEEAA